MKRVLIITYYWPPTGGSGVQRWLKMSRCLPACGWQPVIYTPSNPERTSEDPSLLEDVPEEAEILTRPILEPYSLFRLLTGNRRKSPDSRQKEAVNPISGSSGKSFRMKAALWIRANLFLPDPRFLWIRPSVRFLKKYLKEHPVDAIVSTGPPHSMHLIARKLHRQTGIRWIADFRDPWTGIFYFKHLPLLKMNRKRHDRLERSVLEEADGIVVVTSGMADEFRSRSGIAPEKIQVIENGYDEKDFSMQAVPDTTFTLLHTGLFSSEGNPVSLWKVLGELCRENEDFRQDLRLELIGKTDREVLGSISAAGLEPWLHDRGYLPHKETNLRQMSAKVLILPLRTEPEAASILTGKFFEYIAAGHPIVAFGPHGSVLERELARTGTGRLFGWEEEKDLKKYLTEIYSRFLKDKTSSCQETAYNLKAVSEFSRRKLTEKFADIL